MKILLDTHIFVWAANGKLPPKAAPYVLDAANTLMFSSAGIWELVIKYGRKSSAFFGHPESLYKRLLSAGYQELPVTARHTLRVSDLPPIHKDPFDRIMLAQAMSENIPLLTSDKNISKYPGPVIMV
jgi:PIN domain nuclease of toxin-antitoxin system